MRSLLSALVVCTVACGSAAAQESPAARVSASDLAAEVQAALHDELKLWFPRCIDEANGGYHQAFNHAWEKVDQPRRTLVFQSRMLWVNATMAAKLPELAEQHRAYAAHGLTYIREQFVDPEHGGMFWDRMIDGSESPMHGEKHAYALAFAIYAASSAHDVMPDAGALDLAIETFRWLDEHAHDAEHGGYFEALARDGTPLLSKSDSPRDDVQWDALGTAYGYKSMNTHLHLLEAFTALYRRWQDPVLKERLLELHQLMIGPMLAENGSIPLFFTPDWRPVPGHSSYGHDVEAAYLLLESADALGMAEDPATLSAARKLVDHALRDGWDRGNGGFFYEGQAFSGACVTDKRWWTQAEGLNALLLMHERFGRETPEYGQKFVQTWRFIQNHQIDRRHGGWLHSVSATGQQQPRQFKGNAWKACYHNGRAMINVVERLWALPAELQQFEPPALPIAAADADATADTSAKPLTIDVLPGVNPWTHLNFEEDPDVFHFAIVSDNTGRARPGVFRDAMTKLNWLRPKFVINVGDLIQGAGREEAANRQWDAFLKDLAVLEPPFFFVPGNHDISNPALRKVYNERIGRPYYHFVYRNVLFLCVDIQDHEARRIGPEQLAYFRKVLDENRDVRWTFIFAHKPAWWMEEELSQPFEGWPEFEGMLQDRPYTVFTGHVHRYLKQDRHGREYYTLATTGGMSGQRGPEMGEFDQIVWVTMTHNGPIIANIDITGILSPELRNELDMDIADRGKNVVRAAQTLRFDGSHLEQPLDGTIRFRNGTRLPARITMVFDQHPQMRGEPRVIEQDVAAGSGNFANVQAQEVEVPFRLVPLRRLPADEIVPIRLTGRIDYQLADGRTVSQPLEQTVHIQPNWPLAAGTAHTDGKLDEWGTLRFAQTPREIGGNSEAWRGDADANVSFDARHDDEFVYIAVRVQDDILHGDAENTGDRIDLWLDARPLAQRSVADWQKQLFDQFIRISLVRTADGVALLDADKLPEGTRFSSSTADNVWSAEVAIPVAYIVQMQGEGWTSLRLNVIYQDVDAPGERPAVIAWMPDWRWRRNIPASGTFVRVSGESAVGSGQ